MCGCECVFMCSRVCEFSSNVENYLFVEIVIVIKSSIFNAFSPKEKKLSLPLLVQHKTLPKVTYVKHTVKSVRKIT